MDRRRLEVLEQRIRAARESAPESWPEVTPSPQDRARTRWLSGWMFAALGTLNLVFWLISHRSASETDGVVELLIAGAWVLRSLRHGGRPWVAGASPAGVAEDRGGPQAEPGSMAG